MINIVLYGTFLWVLLTGYPNIIKSELLNDIKEVWGDKTVKNMYDGINKRSVKYLTSSMGNIYKNYGYNPLEKILVVACAMLACSQFLVGKDDYLYQGINNIFSWFLM